MTIKEAEEQTGLKRSNIRFYEKEKLIEPTRNAKNMCRKMLKDKITSFDAFQIEKYTEDFETYRNGNPNIFKPDSFLIQTCRLKYQSNGAARQRLHLLIKILFFSIPYYAFSSAFS